MSIRIASYLGETASSLIGVISARSRPPARPVSQRKRLTRVQFGNYGETFERFKRGGSETYYWQRNSVAFTGELARRPDVESVTVISLGEDIAPSVMDNGVHVAGVRLYPDGQRPRKEALLQAVAETRPTHLLVESPFVPLISWGINRGVSVGVMLADSFRSTGLRASVAHKMLRTVLNASAIGMITNHNLAASLDLYRIGVDPRKIVPCDFPALISPRDYAQKTACVDPKRPRLLYVGLILESKGVGDLLDALKLLRARGRDATLTIIGGGEVEQFRTRAAGMGLAEAAQFVGVRAHDDVIAAMRDHDLVLVPSRRAYPEGLPMTLYEALCTRTPLVTSDHPMFALKIKDRQNALVFAERDVQGCARCIEELLDNAALYAQLSHNTEAAADEWLCPTKFDQAILGFLDDKAEELCQSASLSASYADHLTRRLA